MLPLKCDGFVASILDPIVVQDKIVASYEWRAEVFQDDGVKIDFAIVASKNFMYFSQALCMGDVISELGDLIIRIHGETHGLGVI